MNTAIFSSLVWQLKMLTVVIGAVALALITSDDYYFYHLYSESEFYLAMVIVTFMVSTIWVIFALIDALSENELLSRLDQVFHLLGGILLLIGMICWFVDVGKVKNNYGGKSAHIQRIFAGIFGGINSVLYVFISVLLFKSGSGPQSQ